MLQCFCIIFIIFITFKDFMLCNSRFLHYPLSFSFSVYLFSLNPYVVRTVVLLRIYIDMTKM